MGVGLSKSVGNRRWRRRSVPDMRVQVVTVNHGTTAYADLLLPSLLTHHRDTAADVSVLVLDNESGDVDRLEWAKEFGVRIRPSGYPERSRQHARRNRARCGPRRAPLRRVPFRRL